jgi:hypothetical protein
LKTDEFEELNILGKRFEGKKEDVTEPIESKSDKETANQILDKIKIFNRFILKILNNLFRKILFKIKIIWCLLERKIHDFKIKHKKDLSYKIVETKKIRRNKVIITRKRVPISINYSSKNKIKKPSLYYLSLKSNQEESTDTRIDVYSNLKESIWDFPVKK